MKQLHTRVCVYPKIIQRITGKSERYGRKLLNIIKQFYAKEAYQFITIESFATIPALEKMLLKSN